MNIYSEISVLKGVGPKLKEKLNKSGIFTILDLLLYFPRDYDFINGDIDIKDIKEDEKIILRCKAIAVEKDVRTRTSKTISTIVFNYGNVKVKAKWFNQFYIKNNFRIGMEYNLIGKYKRVRDTLEVVNPIIGCNEAYENEIIPKYSLKNDLTANILVKLIHLILQNIIIQENLPEGLIRKYNLLSLDEAIRTIHFPKDKETLKRAIERLKFQELFTYSIKLLIIKKHLKNSKNGIAFNICEELKALKECLPYNLTNAQSRVVREILIDQKRNSPMNRLVQGDVGSGKTVVALIAMFNAYMNGYQVAMMVPTEILATQHYLEARKLLDGFNVDIELLTGSTSNKEKCRIKEKIKMGEKIIVIGTHALIQEDVKFENLGFIVTDEQHRFGVEQRSKLINKSKETDCLVMTATPIPRTLALYLYSDLDVSIIDELPPGRKKVETMFYDVNKRQNCYSLAREEVLKGRQVYIVSPLIEENNEMKLKSVEELYEELKRGVFSDINIEMLHGKMSPKEKDEVITKFKNDETKVIISTTVIEVGVNVPNASIMIIENAERFGLAQLHQLRGRVGRGQYQSYCLLIANAKNEVTKRRMEIMTESNDGFYISEQDLKIRGSGDMFGMRQSGDAGFILADVVEDMNILRCASEDAKKVINSNEREDVVLCNEIMKNIERSSTYICFN
ncbi:ATP-dependent DNA helicase RecG [Clostridium cavendishii DSM 21758]|uniref:ATP-dependent DNA helicase RecG n=1 Tax=Clostridium cavendishii DSM 21758 TaxID=1121302 RepID=A0A1M6K8I1_9CLOT|nr:ATP-dependent DNA helicase RecG [Clostridium cavendishii]SHJ55249.1 ATP-dependent DNA helicase RecG [Clostridium cavendishii DSM 21758]